MSEGAQRGGGLGTEGGREGPKKEGKADRDVCGDEKTNESEGGSDAHKLVLSLPPHVSVCLCVSVCVSVYVSVCFVVQITNRTILETTQVRVVTLTHAHMQRAHIMLFSMRMRSLISSFFATPCLFCSYYTPSLSLCSLSWIDR